MAPTTSTSHTGQKRPLSMVDGNTHQSKKPRRSYHRHHNLTCKPQSVAAGEPAIIEQETLDRFLVGAIKVICEEQAAQRGDESLIIESLALEAFRNVAEEFVLKVCAMTRRSMLSARRTAPIPTDFESAMRSLDLPWPDDQLKPFTTKPSINPVLLLTPPPEDVFHREHQLPTALLGPGLDGRAGTKDDYYIPSHLPRFPSQHTYKDTPVYPDREVDPRRIRELATEEGKLGEEALRKLAGAVQVEKTISTSSEITQSRPTGSRRGTKKPEESMDSMFETTMRELLRNPSSSSGNKFELGPIVNCEKRFLMQESAPTRRRPPEQIQQALIVAAEGAESIFPMSAKARGKQRAGNVV